MANSSAPQATSVPATVQVNRARLRPPALPASLLARDPLLETLQSASRSGASLTLLSSPLGYGKSTLMAAAAARITDEWGWLRCSEDDNQPQVLLYHLLALTGAPLTADDHDEQQLTTRLFNALEERNERFTLFLDDLQLIRSPRARRILDQLLCFAAPQLTIVAACEGLPDLKLAQLRRDQRLQLIGTAELALDNQQIAQLAARRDMPLNNDQIYQLRTRSEGWISGVLLALSALADSVDPADYVSDFLEQSLLQQLPVKVQHFLLQTSVVGAFNPELAALLSGEAQAERTLRWLARHDLFIQTTNDDPLSHRYHPALRETCMRKLQRRSRDAQRALHLQAADWLLQHGCYGEAVYQLGRGGDYNRLLAEVEQHSFNLLREGKVDSIVDFLLDLPERDTDHLTLAITEASTVIATNDINRARHCLLLLQRMVREAQIPTDRPERLFQTIAFLRSRLAVLGGNYQHGLRLTERSMRHWPQRTAASAVLLYNRASCLFALGELDDAEQAAHEALEQLTQFAFRGYTHNLHLLLTQIDLARGDTQQADERLISLLQHDPAANSNTFYDLFLNVGQALVQMQLGRFEAARQQLAQAESAALEVVHSAALPWVLFHQGCLYDACGQPEQAIHLWEESRRLAWHYRLYGIYRLAGAWRARLAARLQDDATIKQLLVDWRWCEEHYGEALHTDERLAYAWVLCHQGRSAEALLLADQLLGQANAQNNRLLALQSHLVKARAYRDSRQRPQLLNSLEQALQLSLTHRFGQLLQHEGKELADDLRQLLSPAFRRQQQLPELPAGNPLLHPLQALLGEHSAPQTLIEPLTRREQDVLRRIARGQGNPQIADGLSVSLSTVKTHINNLFRKLGASERQQALQIARTLKLID
ncbi:MAG: LuxR C-terminal-related transcriptional regulator [Pseudomonadaceae bacterium]